MTDPLVSVITPVFNGENFIRSTLQSVFDQDYSNFEVIVIDDGSEDGTAQIIKSFPSVRYHYQQNQGIPRARNAGLSLARGEFVAFIDADDLWMPNKLSLQADHLRKNPEAGCVLTLQRLFAEGGGELPVWYAHQRFRQDHIGYFPSTLMARRYVFEIVGNYNPLFPLSESADWFARVKDAGIRIDVLNITLLQKRIHNLNAGLKRKETRSEMLSVLKQSIERKKERGSNPPPEVTLR